MSTSRQLEIEFSSGRSATAPATWGQQAVWDAVRGLGPADAPRYNVSLAAPVDPGVPVAVVLDALRQLLHLHDSLHTRLREDDAGRLEQTVDAAGRLTVVTRQCTGAEDVAQDGALLLAELAGQPFDCTRDWPLRVGLVESAGLVRHLTFVLSHTAVDAWGLRRLAIDLTAIVQGDSAEVIRERHPALQPVEEAAFQVSERGRRRDTNARRHWDRKLRLGPPRLFAPPAEDAGTLRFPNAVLNSPALARALEHVAAGHRVSSSAVLLAAASVMTARLSGAPAAVLQVVVNNRFLPGLADAVSTLASEGLFHLTDAAGPFADVVRRAHATSIATYRSAYYDKRLLDRDIARITADGGTVADRSCFFNDTRDLMPSQPPGPAGPQEPAEPPESLERARARTTLSWPVEFEPRGNVSYALDALAAPGSLELSMTADSTVVPRPDMERFLYGMEDLVVAEALALGCA